MPFIKLDSNFQGVNLGAWRIEEDEMFFLERVKLYENEWKRLSEISHAEKRLEWLSSRLCMKELLKIANDQRIESLNNHYGKPYLSNDKHHISYSHSSKYAAAIASLDSEVGIDIEYRKRKKPRNLRTRFLFMNEAELSFYEVNSSMELFLLIWSTKETIYKMHGQGVAFKDNIFLDFGNFSQKDNGILPVIVKKDNWTKSYEISYDIHDEFILTYTRERLYEGVQP
ncbi:MAG: 4'-phosphopantetheinyl transferase superfamily protein [Bacteroidota bacterium]